MDAMEFCKQLDRICKSHWSCESCPLGDGKCSIRYIGRNRESVVKIVEQWAKDHPAKTRQSEFLKQFPNANLKTITRMLPCSLDETMKPLQCAKYGYLSITCRCDRRRDDYWNEEVTDND